jgi:hypothetical protein
MKHTSLTHAAIDRILEQRQSRKFRSHLGASIIGRDCAREGWYTFRWAARTAHSARILRLFDRGHREEERFIKWLRDAGVHAVPFDPETGKQIRIEDLDGHFGGSLDAELFDTPDFPGIWILGEFKTHNDKSFKELKKKGVRKAHPTHFTQAQIYMHKRGLPFCLYFSINKNDDDIYTEIIEYDAAVAEMFMNKAARIIAATEPPPRISDSPAWFQCQFCDFRGICHFGQKKEQNCRTCVHSRPVQDAQWKCMRYDYILTEAEQAKGCLSYEPIPE